MIPFTYTFRSALLRRRSMLGAAVGIALVVFVLAGSQMLSAGLARTLASSGQANNAVVLRKGAETALSSVIAQDLIPIIASHPAVAADRDGQPAALAEVVMVLSMAKASDPDQLANVQLRGVPPNALAFRRRVAIIEGRPARPGTDEVIIGKRLSGQFEGLVVGESFELKRGRSAKVVGVFEAQGSAFESEVWADVDTVRTSFGREGIASMVTVRLRDPQRFNALRADHEADKRMGVAVIREPAYYEEQSQGTVTFVASLGAALVFFFSLAAGIGAMVTMYGAVQNRRREIGVMRALGFSGLAVLVSFQLESLLLALAGGLLGVAASTLLGTLEFTILNATTWSQITFALDSSPTVLWSSLLLAVALGVLGGFLPALAAAVTSPLRVMRNA